MSSEDLEIDINSGLEESPRIKIHDFRRPERFFRDQLRTLHVLHESFARQVTLKLGEELRVLCGTNLVDIHTMTYEEFTRGASEQELTGLIKLAPLPAAALISLEEGLCFSILTGLFGGKPGEKDSKASSARRLTQLDQDILQEFLEELCPHLRAAWKTVAELDPRPGDCQIGPERLQIATPSEIVVLINLEIQMGEAVGELRIIYPYTTLEPLLGSLLSGHEYGLLKKSARADAPLRNNLAGSLRVVLYSQFVAGAGYATPASLAEIKPGDQIFINRNNSPRLFYETLSRGVEIREERKSHREQAGQTPDPGQRK